jgi:hypothetical protein
MCRRIARIFSTISKSIDSLYSLMVQILKNDALCINENLIFQYNEMEIHILLCTVIFIQKNYKVYFDLEVSFTVIFFLNSYVALIVRFIYCEAHLLWGSFMVRFIYCEVHLLQWNIF